MSQLRRSEIEKLATGAFAIAHERIAAECAEERRRVMSEVAGRGNVGGYLPGLTTCAQHSVRVAILALAEAYVDAFTLAKAAADVDVERSLEKASLQIAGGSVSGVCGELDLLARRTRIPLNRRLGHIEREVEKSRLSALNEARLKLERQRAETKIAAAEGDVRPGRRFETSLVPLESAPVPRRSTRKDSADCEEAAARRREFIEPFLQKTTLSGIATRSGVCYSSLHRWRGGETRLSPENRSKLADRLKVDPARVPN